MNGGGITPNRSALQEANDETRAGLETVCGVDVSGSDAVLCFVPVTQPLAPIWIPVKARASGPAGAREIAAQTLEAFSTVAAGGCTSVWLETPFTPQPKSAYQLGRTIGAVAAGVPTSISLDEISANEWRKILGVKLGSGSKQRAQWWAIDQLAGRGSPQSMVHSSDHHSDSYGIARAILESRRLYVNRERG